MDRCTVFIFPKNVIYKKKCQKGSGLEQMLPLRNLEGTANISKNADGRIEEMLNPKEM